MHVMVCTQHLPTITHATSAYSSPDPALAYFPAPFVDTLADEVEYSKIQLAEILYLITAQQCPVPTTAEPSGAPLAPTAVGQVCAAVESPTVP